MQIIIINIWNRSSAKATPTIWVRVCARARVQIYSENWFDARIYRVCCYNTHIYWILNDIRIGWINFRFRCGLFCYYCHRCFYFRMYVFTHDECNGHLAGSRKKNYYQHSKMCSMNTSTLISHFIYRMRYEMQESNRHKNSLSILFYGFFGRLAIDQRNKSI